MMGHVQQKLPKLRNDLGRDLKSRRRVLCGVPKDPRISTLPKPDQVLYRELEERLALHEPGRRTATDKSHSGLADSQAPAMLLLAPLELAGFGRVLIASWNRSSPFCSSASATAENTRRTNPNESRASPSF